MFEKKDDYEKCCGPEIYQIRIEGHLKDRWTKWLGCMTLTREEDGTTTLYGRLPDQTALHSIFLKLRDLNLKIISFKKIEAKPEDPDCPDSEAPSKTS